MKHFSFLAVLALFSSLAFAKEPSIKIQYGEPSPRATTGFGDLRPLARSKAEGDVLESLNNLESFILAGVSEHYQGDDKTRLLIDVSTDHYQGPVIERDGELHTEFEVRLQVQRYRAVFEHRIYQISVSGDDFHGELVDAVQDFLGRPKVAQMIPFSAEQAVALK